MGGRSPARRAAGLAALLALVAALCPGAASAEAVLYRIFLTDGTSLVSYGEFARVADRVVFSMPIGDVARGNPDLRLVSVPDARIDWPRTEQYAETVRARRYAETRGEEEFVRLSAEIARTLNAVAHAQDARERLAIATRAQQMLAEWPQRNHGYRAEDVRQLALLLEEVVADLRLAAGESRVTLSLVAQTSPPPAELLPPPTLRETIEQAFTLARITPDTTERVALLESVVQVLAPLAGENWAAALRTKASAELRLEVRTERAYAALVATTLAAAAARGRVADVQGIEGLVRQVLAADDRLGRRRPLETAALLATLDARLADARRLRLELDAFAARRTVLRAYQRNIRKPLDQFRESAGALEEIRALAGPSPRELLQVSERASRSLSQLATIKPPTDLHTVHGLITSAFHMAAQAADVRRKAVRSTSMELAWQASSAAAGALMLFQRASAELERLATPPQL